MALTDATPTRAAIYCRISKDDQGDELGVKRQERDCRELAARRGWVVDEAHVYVDNDLSAFSGKARPRYLAMLEAVRDSEVAAVVAWHPDRLHRSPRELEDFIDVIERTGAGIATCTAGDIDLSTSDGRLTARIVGSVARKESEDKSRRLKRKHQEIAESGRPSGGGFAPFGFEADRVTVIEAEAEMLRDAAARFLSGESLSSICRSWNAAGKLTNRDSEWRVSTLRLMLIAPRIAGLRAHRGEVVGKAVWPAILDERTWEQVRARLLDPARKQERPIRSYVLGGLARCARCGTKMGTAPKAGRRSYVCPTKSAPGKAGCGGIAIVAEPLEELVIEAALRRLDSPKMAKALAADRRADAEVQAAVKDIAKDEAKLIELAEMWDAGDITRAEWVALREKVERRLEVARRKVDEQRGTSALNAVLGPDVRERWEHASIEQRRAIMGAVIERVNVGPARRGLNRFDPERAEVVWRF